MIKLKQMQNSNSSDGTKAQQSDADEVPTSRQNIANTPVMCSQSGVSPGATLLTYERVLQEVIDDVTEAVYGSNFTPIRFEFSETVIGNIMNLNVCLNSKVVYTDSYSLDSNTELNKELIRKRFLSGIIYKWKDSVYVDHVIGQPIPARRSSSGDRKMFP